MNETDRQFQSLVHGFLVDTATPEEIAELERVLASSPARTREFTELVLLEEDLRFCTRARNANSTLIGALMSEPRGDESSPSAHLPGQPTDERLRLGGARLTVSLAAGMAVALAACLALLVSWPTQTPSDEQQRTNAVAVLYDGDDAVWKRHGNAVTSGTPFSAGERLGLESGLAEIALRSGVQLVLQGPAELELLSDMEVLLLSGQASVKVPPDAIGFAVRTEAARILDLGTEFGVVAMPDGQAEVVVFDGEVVVSPAGKPDLSKHLFAGASALTGKATLTEPAPDLSVEKFIRKLPPAKANGRGKLVANFRRDYEDGKPNATTTAERWSYLWNATGPQGNPAHYKELRWNGTWGFTANGVGSFPAPYPAGSLHLREIGGHPGRDARASVVHDFGHGPIVAFEVPEDGNYEIDKSWLTRLDNRQNDEQAIDNDFAIDVMVHVNSRPAELITTGYGLDRLTFDIDLPQLRKGDKIYVAVGPHLSSRYDTFHWNFSIVQTK